MPESTEHMKFVNLLIDEAKKIVPSNFHVFIFADKPDFRQVTYQTKDNFIPDLYYNHNDLLIIGEAKSSKDVSRLHSTQQYKSYYQEALKFRGRSILLFAVPWFAKGEIKNIIKKYNKENRAHIETRVICEVGRAEVL